MQDRVVTLWVDVGSYFKPGIVFPCTTLSPSIALENLNGPEIGLKSHQAPKLGEWTRIEISFEEENGKAVLTFSVGGNEVQRKDLGDFEEFEAIGGITAPVEIFIGLQLDQGPVQPGFTRGLIVLDKQ